MLRIYIISSTSPEQRQGRIGQGRGEGRAPHALRALPQRLQYPVAKEYTLSLLRVPIII